MGSPTSEKASTVKPTSGKAKGLVKKYWGGEGGKGEWKQRGGGSPVFEHLVRVGSFNFHLPVVVVVLFCNRDWQK